MSRRADTEQQAAAVERPRSRHLPARRRRDGQDERARRPLLRRRARPGGGVERILAFTFTERAADQLRRRIRDELAARIREAEGDRLEALREALEGTDRAWISTIHGFCRRLLASHPAAAGIDPRFRVVDEAEAERLAIRAFDSALEEMVESGEPEALELAAANRRRTLLEMTRGAYDELRSHGDPSPALPQLPPPDTAAAIAGLVEAARAADIECEEAEWQVGGEPGADRPRDGARSGAPSGRRPPRIPARPRDQVEREGLRRRGMRALYEVTQASPGRGGRPRARARLRAAPGAGGQIRSALRGAQGGPRGARLRGPPAEGGGAPRPTPTPCGSATASSSTI